MRHRFAREGVEVAMGRTFEKLSMTWDAEPMPVTGVSDLSQMNVTDIIGWATALEREEDGWISAEIEWNSIEYGYDFLLKEKVYELSIAANKVEPEATAFVITAAHITVISVVPFQDLWSVDT